MNRILKINLKGRLYLFLLLPFILINACKKDTESYAPKMVLGSADSISVPHQKSQKSLVFVSNVAWNAKTNVDWIVLQNTSGSKGLDSIYFAVEANPEKERKGKIIITTERGDISQEVTIIQETGLSNNFFVKKDASGKGHQWAEATSLSKALEKAASGDTIFVAAGTYKPNEVITKGDPASDGDKTFEISKNITIIGGFPEDAVVGAVSDPATFKTVFSGSLNNGNVAYHVVSVSAPVVKDQKVTFSGLTITGGKAVGSGSIVINGATFYRNNGGGVSIGHSRVHFKQCKIIDNEGAHGAGAMFVYGGEVTIENSQVNNNTAGGNGGAIWAYSGSNISIYNSRLNDNYSKGTAGAIYIYPDGELFMYNSKVINNKGESYGAGVYLRESKGALINCLITKNSSSSDNGGGGLLLYGGSEVKVVSTTISENDIKGPGGGIYRQSGDNQLSIYNSIISGNKQQGSKDVAAAAGQPTTKIQSSVIGMTVYNSSGAVLGDNFDATKMLNNVYLPIGSSNPALQNGMNAQMLLSLNEDLEPPLNKKYITTDLNGSSRSGKNIMGALVE